jgi:hypothetical protein
MNKSELPSHLFTSESTPIWAKKLLIGLRTFENDKKDYEVQPEYKFLQLYNWEGMITTRFEFGSLSKDNGAGAFRREGFVRALMNDLRKKWKLRKNQMYWAAAIEFGNNDIAHAHILINFYPLIVKGLEIPDLSNLSEILQESAERIRSLHRLPIRSVNSHWTPTFDSDDLVRYICKVEFARPHKVFYYSQHGKNWKKQLSEFVIEKVINSVERGEY